MGNRRVPRTRAALRVDAGLEERVRENTGELSQAAVGPVGVFGDDGISI